MDRKESAMEKALKNNEPELQQNFATIRRILVELLGVQQNLDQMKNALETRNFFRIKTATKRTTALLQEIRTHDAITGRTFQATQTIIKELQFALTQEDIQGIEQSIDALDEMMTEEIVDDIAKWTQTP